MSKEKINRVLQEYDRGGISKGEATALINRLRETPEVEDVRHPAISWGDRATIKNFGVNPQDSIKFLKKKYPKLTFKSQNQDILIKGKDEPSWKKLDPSTFEMEDISDAIADIGAGTLETLATVGGGLAGGLVGTPIGGVAGGVAAGAATGAGTEFLRQKAGQALGVAGETDPGRIQTSAIFGGAFPALFGTGAKAAATTVARNLGKEAASNLVQSQAGLAGRMVDLARTKIGPRIGQSISGIDKQSIKWAADNLDKIRKAEETFGQANMFEEIGDQIKKGIAQTKAQKGAKYADALDALNAQISAGKVETPLRKLLDKYADKATLAMTRPTKGKSIDFQNYKYLLDKFEEYARKQGLIEGRDIQHYIDTLNDLTNIRKNVNVGKMEAVDRELQNAARQTVKNVDKELAQTEAGRKLKNIKSEYAKVLKSEKEIDRLFKNPEKVEQTLLGLLSPKRSVRRKTALQLGEITEVPMVERARESIATSIFARPSSDALSLGGTTSTSRTVPLAAAGATLGYLAGSSLNQGHGSGVAGAVIGGMLGAKVGGPKALRSVMNLNERLNLLGKKVQGLSPFPRALPAVQTGGRLWGEMESPDITIE